MAMVGVIKAILGVVSAGTGATIPIAINKLSGIVPSEVKGGLKNTFENADKQVSADRRNLKVQKALKDLQGKGCRLVRNTENDNDTFNALYACRGEKEQADFYYLGKEFSSVSSDESILEKVLSVNYEKGEDNKTDRLSLKLEKSKEVKWNIASQGQGGWSHFRNVDISKQCKITKYDSREEALSCQFKDFSYSFAIL